MLFRSIGLLIISLFLISGCQQNQSMQNNGNQNDQDEIIGVGNKQENRNMDTNDIADHLADVASRVPNVNNATALIAGPYAVVGIDVDEHLDRSKVGTIKYSVSEALYHDPYGKTAVVVADADLNERIKNMNKQIRQGYPVQGIVDELAAIVGRNMPEFPISDTQPEEQNENEEIIPENERDQLENIQKDQSKEQ